MASYGRAVTGTAVMARSANEEKKKKPLFLSCLHMRVPSVRMSCRQSLLEDRQRDMTKWVSGFSLPLTPVCTVIGMLYI